MEDKFTNIVGPPVHGKNLKYRDEDIAEILSRISAGNSILLIGLRRIGKSSVMQAILKCCPDSWISCYQDMESKKQPADLFTVFLQAFQKTKKLDAFFLHIRTLPKRAIDLIQKNIQSLSAAGVDIEFNKAIIEYWEPLTSGLEKIIGDSKEPILIILDEFPVYLELMLQAGYGQEIVQRILGLLKTWRGKFPHFRMIAGGSISLDRILVKNHINPATINDFSRYLLQPFKKEQAAGFLKELAATENLTWFNGNLIGQSLDLIGDYYPFFLHSFFQELRTYGTKEQHDLDEIFENHFMPSIQKGFFQQYLNRLEIHYTDPEQKAAKVVLDFLSKQENFIAGYSSLRAVIEEKNIQGIDLDTLFMNLCGDEFLYYFSRTCEYTFATTLVARWWRMTRGRK